MEVAAIADGLDHVCARYRLAALGPELMARGVNLTIHSLPRTVFARLALYRKLRAVDAIVLQRVLLPNPELRALRRWANHLIFDYDDAVWLRDSYHPRGPRSHKRLRRFRAVCACADTLFAGNAFLAENAGFQAGPGWRQVVVVPTVVNPTDYPVADPTAIGSDARLTWIGSGSTLQGLTRIGPHFAAIGDRLPGVTVRMICDRAATLPGVRVELVPWARATEARSLADADIGISWVPDDDWSRGKCGLKLVQYLAAGLPAVANPVGVHAELLRGAGLLATTPREWADAVHELAVNPKWRAELGRAGRARIEADYSVTRAVELWGVALGARPAHV